jgi:TetR/AcrR family transcriptional regulator, cholesterol catabolism regulator
LNFHEIRTVPQEVESALMPQPMTYTRFRRNVMVSMEDICRDIFRKNRPTIKIKKEAVGIKNLVTIFKATLKLSNDKGFHAMSLRDLSRETGLSMGALYSYFAGKEELLEIIHEQGRAITFSVLNEHVAQQGLAPERLESAVRTHLYLSEVMQDWFFFAYMETRYFRKAEHKRAMEGELYTEKLFCDILEQGQREGVFYLESSVLTASAIKAMLQDWYLKRWKYTRRKISIDTYADFILSMIRRSIWP